MSNERTTIELDASQLAKLREIARRTGHSESEVLSEALSAMERSTLKNGDSRVESFFEAASRAGFIGCMKEGPFDLSTNPAYLEGLGEDHADARAG